MRWSWSYDPAMRPNLRALSVSAIVGLVLIGSASGCAEPSTSPTVEAVNATLAKRISTDPTGWRSAGIDGERVDAQLRADQSALADSLIHEFGNRVSVRLGNFPHPDRGTGMVTDVCVDHLAGAKESVNSLTATVRLASLTVAPGADFRATVTVKNVGNEPRVAESEQPLTAVVLRPGTDELLATYEAGIAGTGLGLNLAPGAGSSIDVYGGTASCDPELGWALPRGNYQVVVLVPLYRVENDRNVVEYLATPRVSLRVG